ncbi:MAG: nucleoside kinase, partial [Sphaerochaetaceae bacterium]|nr:nucleoside kinase [Sphaerochaetaceae bacterium]
MNEIKLSVKGKKIKMPAFSTAKEILLSAGEISSELKEYKDNPVVGALINGELMPLGAPVAMSCTVEPVRAFQGFGRRIYRHSICYLLSYASKLLYPKRKLVIGHSLGDGFYFNFEDGIPTDGKDIKALSEKMCELVSQALDIDYVTLSSQDAIKVLNKQGYKDAVMLIKSMSRPSVQMYKIQDYYNIAYEPIVSNTKVMGLWELRQYGTCGMLLRYPVKEDIQKISEFKDNDRLFEVFEENRAWGRILGVRCVGEMNEKRANNTAEQYVRLSESLQRRKIASIADEVHNRKAKAVFIAGPSSSGKTTFAKRLSEQLLLLGHSPIRISLDDYYKKRELTPLDEEGKHDLETIEALDTDMFERNMDDLFAGKEVDLPHYSFKTNETFYLGQPIKMSKETVFVIEGLHGLNPKITSKINPKYVYKVYISALTQLNMDDSNRVSTTDDRMLRRILRDYMTRNTSAEETLLMWPSVSRGERIHIFPNQNNADVMFNSALDYELGVLSPFVTPLLHGVSPDSGTAYTHAQRL